MIDDRMAQSMTDLPEKKVARQPEKDPLGKGA